MKTIALALITLIFFPSCECTDTIKDGKPARKCRWVGPTITASVSIRGISGGITLWGEPSQPTIVIPINKHDPEPILTK